ncbi:39S ribosomal protein L12, mitochondrial-like isoform X2 [Orbicella faveolata]|uniref:39S ribosomal protein L12, mitochondrial-like isoform X2 n=1 Tax=Orbicella faveolata TaxID=48498 RepID=UPI0009E5C04A|nr:39S ribosomal protein L12, mitochondrial-like isoform X2 [Orbicella faveolata]
MAARATAKSLRLLASYKATCYRSYSSIRWRIHTRFNSAAYNSTLSAPQPDDAVKEYPEKITNIVDEISKLTLIEVADLNELLKKTLKIEGATMMPMMGGMPMAAAPAQEEEAETERAEPTEFTVKLTQFDAASKVKLIKEIKNLVPGLNLVQAKKFVESLPQNVKEKVSKEEADEMKKVLEAVGGTVEIGV